MAKFLCNKIGRDKGRESFKSQNIVCNYKILKGEELGKALKEKLIEESLEVKSTADYKELIAELADVLEVVSGLCNAYNISNEDIEKTRKQKNQERGAFQEGFYVESLEMNEDNPRITHFRKSPEKYPELAS